ncbi:MAG: class IV adenylate cyclase [Bacteroidales bacterium]|nr:class IV adenylate cyclase [Bacteroidales bacterium]
MKETEIKILEINRKEIEKKLIDIGAKKVFEGDMTATFWDFKDNSLKKSKQIFRLRKEGEKTTLTFKKPVQDSSAKVSQEFEVKVSDFSKMLMILEALGFINILIMKKHRISYKFENINFEIDNYVDDFDFVPEFLEIESDNFDSIINILEKIGYSKDDYVKFSATELINHYRK